MMEINPNLVRVKPQDAYRLVDPDQDIIEPLPEVWEALEAFCSPELGTRRVGLDALISLDVARRSPLVAYVLATRLDEPDLALRTRVVQVLGDLLCSMNDNGSSATTLVRLQLGAYLAQMRTRRIYALLQVAEADPSTHNALTDMLNHCPYAGTQLASVLADRHVSLSIRRLSAEFIARVGYLDVLPTLERIYARLEARLNGHDLEALTEEDGEVCLLPAVQRALDCLRAP
jgi:hypothetical protein